MTAALGGEDQLFECDLEFRVARAVPAGLVLARNGLIRNRFVQTHLVHRWSMRQ